MSIRKLDDQREERRQAALMAREQALALFNQNIRNDDADANLKRQDTLDDRSTERDLNAGIKRDEAQGEIAMVRDAGQGRIQAETDRRRHGYTIAEINARASAEDRLALRQFERQQEAAGDTITRYVEGADGNWHGLRADGTSVNTGIEWAARDAHAGYGDDDDGGRPRRGGEGGGNRQPNRTVTFNIDPENPNNLVRSR
jgi:hypothetical protein